MDRKSIIILAAAVGLYFLLTPVVDHFFPPRPVPAALAHTTNSEPAPNNVPASAASSAAPEPADDLDAFVIKLAAVFEIVRHAQNAALDAARAGKLSGSVDAAARAVITGAPRPAISVLKVTAKDGLYDSDLNKKLLDLCKDRGLKNVYFVDTLGGDAPRLLYRITPDGTPTGKRELMRGAQLDDLDQRALRSSVEAAGKDLFVANFFGDVPETVLAPALLVDDVTIKRANEKNEKLPFYPPPD